MRAISITTCILLASACGEVPRTFVITESGLVHQWRASCIAGMLISSEGINILDRNSDTMLCSGYIKLTEEEHMNYDN